jgi:transcriptional regulator with XRE-family HTH domain
VSDNAEQTAERRRAFGQQLRAARERAGLSQTATARAAGMDRSFYVEIENGRHSVSVDRLHDIAAAIGVPIKDLFGEEAAARDQE